MQLKITPDLVRTMLACVSPNLPHNERVLIGMSINSELPGDDGGELYDWWRSRGDSYDVKATQSEWRSFTPGGGVGIGTLIHHAQQGGFTFPKPDQETPVPTPAQLAERERKRAERRAGDAQRQQQRQGKAAALSRDQWDAASKTSAANHGYVLRKRVQPYGVRVGADGWLLVPLRDAAGELHNVQRIAPVKPADGGPDKLFQRGGRKSGLGCVLGEMADAAAVLVCEGWATGASLHEATGYTTAVAFDAGNLVHVAKALRALYPDVRIVICGDDDVDTAARTGTNPGRNKAKVAAREVRGLAVFPKGLPPGGSDFNDLHQHAGLDAVRACVAGALAADDRVQRPGDDDKLAERRDPFSVTDAGVYYLGRDKNGDAMAPQWLCSRLEVLARTRDADGLSWGYLLRFADPDGRVREYALPARMLSGDGGEYRAVLSGMGLLIASGPALRARLTEYLQTRLPEARAVSAERSGWHQADGGACYVLPDVTVGEGAERVVFQGDGLAERTFRQRGELAAWRDRVAALCVGNRLLVFAVASAFAGPLLRPASVDSGGFHLRGDSSSGKTTALRVAASVNGAPGYMQRWRMTANAIELVAATYCDALGIFDELAQISPAEAGEAAYLLSNEQGKGRANRNAALRPRLTWRLLFLSAGEISLSDHMQEGGKRARVGQETRMVDLSADAGAGMGVFENLHGREGGAALAHELQRATSTTYGAPGLAWLHWLAPRYTTLPRMLRERTDALRAAWVPEGASGQVERVAARFALVAVAGELATEAGLTGWPAGESERAVRRCFEAWLAARGGAGNAENLQMLRQVRRYLEVNGDGKFGYWHRSADDHAPKTLMRAGWRRQLNADGDPIKSNSQYQAEYGDRMPASLADEVSVEYFITAEVFRTEVCQGFDYRAVCRVLMEHGCLHPDKGRPFDCRPRVPGVGHIQCYRIGPELMALEL